MAKEAGSNLPITIYVIAGNAQKHIADCLKSCMWASQVIVVLANSSDNTETIAKSIFPKAVFLKTTDEYNKNFSKWRNLGLNKVKNKWLLYVDSDEIVTEDLQGEITKTIYADTTTNAYAIPRGNHYLGVRVRHGGSSPDYVKRLFYVPNFKGYTGALHEEPQYSGEIKHLNGLLLHFTHEDLSSMLQKSITWSDSEAKLLYHNKHPPIYWWRFPRMMLTKFFERFFMQSIWRDGYVGIVSLIFEMFNTYMIYARLYELQQAKTQL
jgi:glycosyltransferase involved in cell wall biosynthesis